ncbi:MAG: methylthioribulose 1-phosphate dehydratase [Alphaproteobacteria bacterium]
MTSQTPYKALPFGGCVTRDQAVVQIIDAGKFLDSRGLAPATSGNYSIRLSDGTIVITVSGAHKGRLISSDIMIIDSSGKPLEDKVPSAETLLHTQIYDLLPDVNAILHVHSMPGVVLTRLREEGAVMLTGYEMLKAFPGIDTHEVSISIPVVGNSQDMDVISQSLNGKIRKGVPAYIIRDHGFYVWGKDMSEAERIAEALEYLLSCEMEIMKIKGGGKA